MLETVEFGLEDGEVGVRDEGVSGRRGRRRGGGAPRGAGAAEVEEVDGGVEAFGYEGPHFLWKI